MSELYPDIEFEDMIVDNCSMQVRLVSAGIAKNGF